jgi:fibronectin type 3 domain-containing protein
VTRYSDTGLTPSTRYYYRVRAYNDGGDSNYSFVATAITKLAAPTNLTALEISSSKIKLSWSDVSGEEGYKIECKTGVYGTYTQMDKTDANVVTYYLTGLSRHTTYYCRVQAYNDGGKSDYSNVAFATTQ